MTEQSITGTDEQVQVAVFAQRTLESLRVEQARLLPERVVVEGEWDQIAADVRVMRLRMSGFVLAEKIAEHEYSRTKRVPFPVSPWQFFKQRHADSWWLGWLVRRRPVVFERHPVTLTVQVDRYLSYPEAEITQGLGGSVVHEIARPIWRDRAIADPPGQGQGGPV